MIGDWLRRVFRRERSAQREPPPPSGWPGALMLGEAGVPTTSYGQTFERLISSDDTQERRELARLFAWQISRAVESPATAAQIQYYSLGIELRDLLSEQLGATNDMISTSIAESRAARTAGEQTGAAVTALRAEFHEGMHAFGERLTDLEVWRVEVDADRASFKQSRDRSERERQYLLEREREAKQERAAIVAQVERLADELHQVFSLVGDVMADLGFIEAFRDAVIIVSLDGQILRVNAQTEELFGYHRAELTGKSIEELIPPDLRAQHVTHRMQYMLDPQARRMGHARPGGQARSFPALRADGLVIKVEVGLGPILLGGKPCIIATVRPAEARHADAG